MASPNIDTRKLKDQASEFLGKSKYDKAAEILEQLARVEPKEMQHRLKLGDTYRRLGSSEKAINCYQVAGRFFADEGQLIKAIGAFKVIVEIDPKNEAAQKDLAQMNQRRFAKPTLEAVGLKAPKAIGAGARAVSELELAEGEKAVAGISELLEGGRASLAFEAGAADDEAPLELDIPGNRGGSAPAQQRPPAPRAPAAPPAGLEQRRGPPPKIRPSIQLGRETGPIDTAPIDQPELELDPELEPLDEELPPPVVVTPAVPSSAWRSGPIAPKGAPVLGKVAPLAPPPPATQPPRTPAPTAARPSRPAPDEIELDPVMPAPPARAPAAPTPPPAARPAARAPSAPGAAPAASSSAAGRSVARPIADLLADSGEEEIELISISSEDELEVQPEEPPAPMASGAELDAAFEAITPDEPKLPARPTVRRPAVPLFDDLPQQAFVELVNRLSYKRWAPGEVIIKEGDPGRSFFVIVEGKVRVYKKLADGSEVPLATLGEGAFFGEMALLSGSSRTAHVAAEEETQLLEISDVVLREVVTHYPTVAQSLKNFYRARLVNNVMAISPMFKEFAPAERRNIVERFKMRQATPGEVLIREGQQPDGLYVVLHGAVRVAKQAPDGKEIELARLKEGDLFGEMSLLTSEPASATVSALGPTILLKLPGDQFQELILTHPQILELVSDLVDQRRTRTAGALSGHGPGHDGMSFV